MSEEEQKALRERERERQIRENERKMKGEIERVNKKMRNKFTGLHSFLYFYRLL